MRLRPPRNPRRLAYGALALTTCAGFSAIACVKAEPDPSDERTTLTVLYPDSDEWSIWDNEVPFLVFSTLVALGESGEVEGRLALSWEHSPDYRTWTIHLRSDVSWHDGVPFTTRDVEFTVNLWKHPETMLEEGTRIESYPGPIRAGCPCSSATAP
jgi:ABC-type transport system substrate-binding protein